MSRERLQLVAMPSNKRDWDAWVEFFLSDQAGEEGKSLFIDLVLAAVKQHTDGKPLFVTTGEAFHEFANEPPRRWLEGLGVPRPKQTWVALLQYPANLAGGDVFRPSVLDAELSDYHFPSPPDAIAGPELCGYAVDLGAKADSLVPEYLHAPVDWTREHVVQIQISDPTHDQDIGALRHRHYDLLVRHFRAQKSELIAWMPAPV